jgi:hypothetical protein
MTDHLSIDEVALHLDGRLPSSEQARVDRHLASCDECRAELVALARALRTAPRRKRWYVPVGIAAAAAAAVALLVWPRPWNDRLPDYREPAVTTTTAPVALAPRGSISSVPRLVWSRVPHADRYRVTMFDTAGVVLWESPSTDTSIALPNTLHLRPRTPYFWQVQAETGFDRWIKSDVTEFVIRPSRP